MTLIYQLLGYFIIPLIKFNIYLRLLNYKEDKDRYLERFGISSINRPQGKIIWIHAASIGEFKSAIKIIESTHQKINILVTTTTLTASNYALKHFGDKIIHQYAPFDIAIWVNRFLKKWQPSLIIWIESDLWPTTLTLIKKKSIKSILVNSRISPKSFNRWKYFKFFFKKITNTFDEIYAQSHIDKKRLEILTKRKIDFIGNLKLSYIENIYDEKFYLKLQKKFTDYKIIMFASTHKGEEKKLSNIIHKLLDKYDNLKIIIAPRHPDRSENIANIFKKKSIDINIFENSINFDEKVFVINSFGNMALYFALSEIVILGGSFTKMGGHNPIEPAYNNCVVITGPYIYNWENIYLDMHNFKACLLCQNENELEINLTDLLNNNSKLDLIKKNAKNYANNSFVEIEKLSKKISNYINEI